MSNRFRLTALALAVVFIYGIAIPFVMSDEFAAIYFFLIGH
jgi:hypothetical protein